MNNKQRAAARKAMLAFPTLKPDLTQDESGSDVVTPYVIASPEQRGEPVTVSSGMSESAIDRALRTSCQALING